MEFKQNAITCPGTRILYYEIIHGHCLQAVVGVLLPTQQQKEVWAASCIMKCMEVYDHFTMSALFGCWNLSTL